MCIRDRIREAHDSIRQKDMSKITDDAMVVEQETGAKVCLLYTSSCPDISIQAQELLFPDT